MASDDDADVLREALDSLKEYGDPTCDQAGALERAIVDAGNRGELETLRANFIDVAEALEMVDYGDGGAIVAAGADALCERARALTLVEATYRGERGAPSMAEVTRERDRLAEELARVRAMLKRERRTQRMADKSLAQFTRTITAAELTRRMLVWIEREANACQRIESGTTDRGIRDRNQAARLSLTKTDRWLRTELTKLESEKEMNHG